MANSETPASNNGVHRGSCLCHGVKYTIHGDPMEFVICHCENCQKYTGSAFVANIFFMKSQITVDDPESLLKTYDDGDTTSGRMLHRIFCSRCGSSMFNHLAIPEVCQVTTGTMEKFDQKGWKPEVEGYCLESRKQWVPKIEGTKTFDRLFTLSLGGLLNRGVSVKTQL